jgi:non-ribosomal peptide synthetase component F/pimeloyl-ACP methyl ester carboxylesterase
MREIPAHPAQASAYSLTASLPLASACVQLSLSLGERSTPELLQAAWQKVAAVHGMLRSGFRKAATGELIRREHEASESPWQTLDWQSVPPQEIPTRWAALLEEDAARPIDPANPPLLRFSAILLPGGHCHVLATFPRFLLDEDSLFHLICEWLEALEGAIPAALPEEEPGGRPATPATADWWKQFFSGTPDPVSIRTFPAPTPTTPASRRQDLLLDRETSRSLKRLGQRLGISTEDILFAAWGLVLGRLTSQRRVLLLAPCRMSESLECGFFDNLLPANLSINGGQSIEAFLKTVGREAAERRQHAFIPLERTLALAQPPRSVAQFPAGFSWLPPALNDRVHDTYPRWINSDAQIHRRPLLPLSLEARDGNRLALRLEYDTSAVSPGEAEKLLSRLTDVLDDFLGGPTRRLSELRVLTGSEWEALKKFDTAVPSRDVPSLAEQITVMAARHPDVVAAEGPGESVMTFGELDSHGTSLASWLRHENIADGWHVAICLNQTAWLPVAVLGVLRAGDTAVPLDPSASAAWLVQKLDGYDVEIVICDSATAPLFQGTTRRLLVIDQQWETVSAVTSTAAVSTKTPKACFLLAGAESAPPPSVGVLSPRILASSVAETIDLLQLEPGSRLPLLAPAGFGGYVETLLAGLASGATLLLSQDGVPDTATHLRFTHSQWRAWLAARRQTGAPLPEALQVVCTDAAPIPTAVLTAWQELNNGQARWISVLSPVGLSGASVRHTLPDRRAAFTTPPETPLGFAGPGIAARLHDVEGQPLAPFFSGNAEITLEADQKISVPAWRDLSGCLYFTPPSTAPLERALCALPGVLDTFVAPSADGQPPAAWVVLADGSTSLPEGLREQLGAQVQFVLAVPVFPLSASGAIDLNALPRPQVAPTAAPAGTSARVAETPAREWTPLTPLNKNPDAPLLFLIHDIEGDPARYRSLAGLLSADWSIYATSARGLHQPSACHTSIESEAAALVEAICLLDPEGPYHLVGHGFGGILAFEMARQLRVAKRDVPYLAIAGAKPPEPEEAKPSGWLQSLTKAFRKPAKDAAENPDATPVELAHRRALESYRAKPLEGPAGVILGADQNEEIEDAWLDLLPETFVERMSCNWREMLTEPSVKRLTVILRDSFIAPGDEEE